MSNWKQQKQKEWGRAVGGKKSFTFSNPPVQNDAGRYQVVGETPN